MTENPEWRAKYLRLNEDDERVANASKAIEWWCKSAARNVDEPRRMLVIAGSTGTGKTHMARAAWNYLEAGSVSFWSRGYWPLPPLVFFRDWSKLAGAKNEEVFEDHLVDLVEAKIAILDDVGSEIDKFKSGEPCERLRTVLERCCRSRKWLLITTNVAKGAWTDRYDERVADRLRGAWYVNTFGVPSQRGALNTID